MSRAGRGDGGTVRDLPAEAPPGSRPDRGVSVALLAAVLLAGVAVGGWLAGDARAPAPATAAAVAEQAPRPQPTPGQAGGVEAVPDAPAATRQGSPTSWPAAGTYAPVAGSWVEGGGSRRSADTLMAAPELPGGREPVAGGASEAGPEEAAPVEAAETRPPTPRRAEISDQGAAERIEDPVALATPLLAVQRDGGRVVLYEPRAGGTVGLSREIEGGWGWLGDCRRFRIDIAMGPSREAGTVRAVGRGTGAARVGWAVPVRGCARASRRLRAAGRGPLVDAGGIRWTVEAGAGRITARSSSGAQVWSGEAPPGAVGVRMLGAYRLPAGAGEEVWMVAIDHGGAPRAFLRVVSGHAAGGPRTDGWMSLGAKEWTGGVEE